MPNPNTTMEELLAQQFIADHLPPDCPPEAVGSAAIEFACEVLERITRQEPAHSEFIDGLIFEVKKAVDSMRAVESPNADIAYAMVKRYCPEHLDSLKSVMYQARCNWAKAHAEAEMAQSDAWAAVAPDLRDAVASEVARLWLAGAVSRTMRAVFFEQQDKVVMNLTQSQLYKFLLASTPDLIARYKSGLDQKRQAKLQAELSADTWQQVQAQCNSTLYPTRSNPA